MKNSSEYHFPIFISSTDYNLLDLRAELAGYLSDLGYKPVLSSAQGFPDSSPELEPWESCLPVLDLSFVMILVIDGRYGRPLPWPSFSEIPKINNEERALVSPTHGEYLFAHSKKKRIFVFVREDVMTFYQSYRSAVKHSDSKEAAKELLTKTLPDHIDFETLEFLHEVKTCKPIPWIQDFNDVTTIKGEVQRKLLNQLAEVFLIKDKHLETVIRVINQTLEELPKDKQGEILEKINAAKGIYKKLEEELANTQEELAKVEKGHGDKDSEIKSLKKKISSLEGELKRSKVPQEGYLVLEGDSVRFNPSSLSGEHGVMPIASYDLNDVGVSIYTPNKCEKCGQEQSPGGLLGIDTRNYCVSCNKHLCDLCWSGGSGGHYSGLYCYTCSTDLSGSAIKLS